MEYTILILLLPLASFLVLGLAGMKMRPAAAGAVGTAVLAVVALLSYWTAFEYFSAGRDAAGVFPTLIPWNAVWLPIGGALHIDLGILLDPISVMMLVVISTVSLMVHIYSLGYMKGERGFQRYYAFLSLFTMSMIGLVVAGVYLVARMFPLFIGYAPEVLHWTAYIGAFTALYAAVVACVQSDIKRVLAFSTISQIGFMIVALGVSTSADPHAGGLGYMASMFHLFTHAMFKALLFLGAGCIIHAVHSNEMSAMGGLRRYMPLTHATFLVACLAIAGIWPLSGFFSKDEILTACFAFSPVMGWVMTAIAGLTAFYMFRLYYGIFWGTENRGLHAEHTPHEAPLAMTLPLVLLAAVTCVAGFIPFGEFVSSDGAAYTIHIDTGVAAVSLCVAAAAIALATWMYARDRQPVADRLAATFSGLHRAAYHRFYIDEVYQFITHRVIFACISTPIAWFDRHVVDGFMNFLAWGTNGVACLVRDMQSGSVQRYCIWFLGGALGLTILILLIC